MHRVLSSLSHSLTSRRGAWLWLVGALVVIAAAFGMLGRATMPAGSDVAPPQSESAQAAALAKQLPNADQQTVIAVSSRDDGRALSSTDLASLKGLASEMATATDAKVMGPFPSDDAKAAVVQATVSIGDETGAARAVVESIRETVSTHSVANVTTYVTGGPAFGVDVASAFDGADFTLLLVTLAIVAVLLILTYRSPVLWLIPLAVVGVADQVANKASTALGVALELQFDTGIVSVLVFGAGTNYALLLISRYREELLRSDDRRGALAAAWRATVPAIVASNLTVVLSLATLVLAVIPGTRGLGLASALGLVIAVLAALFVLPPALAVCGRAIFWPLVPKPGSTQRPGRVWRAVAQRVVRRPAVPLAAGLALLAVMAAGLFGAQVGLSQVEKFRVPSESAAGLEVLGEHFSPGQAQPTTVITKTERVDAVTAAIESVALVDRVTLVTSASNDEFSKLSVTGRTAPGTSESLDLVRDVREAAHSVTGADALVGGAVAADLDAREGNVRDFVIVAPLVLAVSLIVLIVLLRALVGPLLLLLTNALSAVAAIGAGVWLSRTVFGWHALDLQVPLLAFLFLVALGIDYTIFLVHRARVEAARFGTKQGVVEAVAHTGGVITSAGVVLAAVFAALGVLPLVTLGQIGLIVGVGVLVDTLVVRTLIVPAIFALVGDRVWWPGKAGGPESADSRDSLDGAESEDAESRVLESSAG